MGIKSKIFKIERVIGRLFYHKHVWLVSDRKMSAGDNGEAFFKYLQDRDVNSVFAISKASKDYDRLCRIGKVVDYDSPMYKFLLCVADCHCSSQLIHMENHTETPQIFLQHGVAEKDITKMINPVSHDNFYIITSAAKEREGMLGDNCSINHDHEWLTGLPRFDYLKNFPKKLVVLAFTWRSNLAGCTEEQFLNSEYYKTIRDVMEDKKLIDGLKTRGYRLAVKLHPEMERFKDALPKTDECDLYTDSYNQMYSDADLMITDYSSSIFDFAILKKSIIYYQFDGGDYFKNNPYVSASIFNYENDGFGPIVYDHEILRDTILSMADRKFVMDDIYKKRVDSFFAYNDKNNCERTFNKIKEVIAKA